MSEPVISIFLADDHTMVREGLAALVAKDPCIRVVGQCGDGLKVVEMVEEARPDVVVLDITMPGLNGLDICRDLVRKNKGIHVLILTMHDDEQFITSALEQGASGYLLKEAAGDQLSEALRRVARGEVYLGPKVPRTVLQRLGRQQAEPYSRLTGRERQVLHLIVEGKTNRDIAAQLGLAVKTIDTHRTRLMRKLNIHDQTSLVKFALRKGIVPLN